MQKPKTLWSIEVKPHITTINGLFFIHLNAFVTLLSPRRISSVGYVILRLYIQTRVCRRDPGKYSGHSVDFDAYVLMVSDSGCTQKDESEVCRDIFHWSSRFAIACRHRWQFGTKAKQRM